MFTCIDQITKCYSFHYCYFRCSKVKNKTPDFSKPNGFLLMCVNTENTVVFCMKIPPVLKGWDFLTRFFYSLLHIRQYLVPCWKEIAEMTALSKYRGHIFSSNTHLSIPLTVWTKQVYLRDMCLRKSRGEWKREKCQIKNRSKKSRIQPESAHKESAFWLSTLKKGLNCEQVNSA